MPDVKTPRPPKRHRPRRLTRATAPNSRPRLLVAAPDGRLFEHQTLEMAIDTGLDLVRPGKRDLKAVPEGWDLMALPMTRPIGYDPDAGGFVTLNTFTVVGDDGKQETFVPTAVALHPPPGYVRTHHPAAEWLDSTHPDEKFRKTGAGRLTIFQDEPLEPAQGGDDGARVGLPLWAYTAVGYGKSGPVAAFFQADETSRWAPNLFYQPDLEEKVGRGLPKTQTIRCFGKSPSAPPPRCVVVRKTSSTNGGKARCRSRQHAPPLAWAVCQKTRSGTRPRHNSV